MTTVAALSSADASSAARVLARACWLPPGATEANLRFYARYGFTAQVEQVMDGVRYFGLRRPPHPTVP